VYYLGKVADGQARIFRMPATGGQPVQLWEESRSASRWCLPMKSTWHSRIRERRKSGGLGGFGGDGQSGVRIREPHLWPSVPIDELDARQSILCNGGRPNGNIKSVGAACWEEVRRNSSRTSREEWFGISHTHPMGNGSRWHAVRTRVTRSSSERRSRTGEPAVPAAAVEAKGEPIVAERMRATSAPRRMVEVLGRPSFSAVTSGLGAMRKLSQ
jgi:hypothetical protein